MGRGPNHIPKAPTNPDERTLIPLQPGPNSTDFADPKIVKCISQLCLQNWPTPVITWASTPVVHKDAVWVEFQKRYRWTDEQGPAISALFWHKYAARTKDNLSKECDKAITNAEIDHEDEPGGGVLYMHKYSPWWCSPDIWAQMCEQWRDEKWLKKRATASSNRYAGVPVGEKAKGTYKGGSISQLQHICAREAQSQGTPVDWLDVYVATRDGLSEAKNIAETYRCLFDECYPEGTERPYFDQKLWEIASEVKKNYVKGQGQRRRPSIYGSGSTQSSQSWSHPSSHTPANCVKAIFQNPELLLTLAGHLAALRPEEVARAVAAATSSLQKDGDEAAVAIFDADTWRHGKTMLTRIDDRMVADSHRKTGKRRMLQLNEPDEFRLQAYENNKMYKEKVKRWHDRGLVLKSFVPGQRVLLFNSRLRLFSAKLKSRWSGPFVVKIVFSHRAVEIFKNDLGQAFKVNGQRLKHYYGDMANREVEVEEARRKEKNTKKSEKEKNSGPTIEAGRARAVFPVAKRARAVIAHARAGFPESERVRAVQARNRAGSCSKKKYFSSFKR
ncbi:hypothetical protein AgCh_025510 [Apium graveolens]